MNRWDEIKAEALSAADLLTPDETVRDKVAAHLIRLSGLMVQAAGKGVAIDGESEMNDIPGAPESDVPGEGYGEAEWKRDIADASAKMRVGEAIQDGARKAVEEAVSADVFRYEASGLTPAWKPSRARTEVPGRLLDCGLCYEEDGQQVHLHPECDWLTKQRAREAIVLGMSAEGVIPMSEVRVTIGHVQTRELLTMIRDGLAVGTITADDLTREVAGCLPTDPAPARPVNPCPGCGRRSGCCYPYADVCPLHH